MRHLTKPVRVVHHRCLILLAFIMTLSSPVAAQDYDKGLAAAKAGDFATALEEWKPLAEAGDSDAQFALGCMYHNGDGVPQDYAEAVKWYRLAADQGDAGAQNSLGAMYDNGHGVPQDYKEAVKWFKLAAEQGLANAQNNLGVMYRNGRGVLQDYKEAVKWFKLAAEQGFSDAQFNLAQMYRNGQGVPQDYKEAVKWYRRHQGGFISMTVIEPYTAECSECGYSETRMGLISFNSMDGIPEGLIEEHPVGCPKCGDVGFDVYDDEDEDD